MISRRRLSTDQKGPEGISWGSSLFLWLRPLPILLPSGNTKVCSVAELLEISWLGHSNTVHQK